MTLQRISHSVSNLRASVVAAAIGAGLCAVALVAVFAMSGNSGGQSTVVSPSVARIEVPSMPGVGVLGESEFVASAFAEHEAYMEAMFGPYQRAGWNEPVDVAFAKSEHERLVDAALQP